MMVARLFQGQWQNINPGQEPEAPQEAPAPLPPAAPPLLRKPVHHTISVIEEVIQATDYLDGD